VLVHRTGLAVIGLAAADAVGGAADAAPEALALALALADFAASAFLGSNSLPTSSTRAMSAESPRRKPALMIRM